MKKKLEAELISIAHRILKLKNKSELVQLHQESQKLYEKLSVLLFVEENFAGLQPTIGKSEAYEVLETAFGDSQEEVSQEAKVSLDTQEEVALVAEKIISEDKENHTQEIKEEEAVEESESENEEIAKIESEEETKSEEIQPQAEEEKVVVGEIELSEEDLDEEPTVFEKEEPTLEEAEEAVDQEVEPKVEEIAALGTPEETKKEDDFAPAFELAFDKKEEETVEEVAKESGHQIIFEDFLGDHYKDLEFVKAEIEKKHEHDHEEENKAEVKPEEEVKVEEPVQEEAPKEEEKVEAPREETKPHVEKVTKGITIGLNDRVGFVNHLFGGSNEDFNRVLSQLNTFDTFQDAKNFIEDLVKPDYNEWKGKEDFEERFLEVVENKFK